MSIAMAPPHANQRVAGASARHSRDLLLAGLTGAHLAVFLLVPILLWARSPWAALSSAVAAVIVIVFFTVGHAVVLRFAESHGSSVMVAALASYTLRVTLLGALLFWYGNNTHVLELDPIAVSIGIIVTVLGWLSAEIWRFTRLRIPVYDEVSTGDER